MPFSNFHGNDHFVAYMDISGFKKMMEERNGEIAREALNAFFNIGNNIIKEQQGGENTDNQRRSKVEGLLISDSCILVAHDVNDTCLELENILEIIRKINKKMFKKKEYLLTTSICYGEFLYQNRKEADGAGKDFVYGRAFVKAYSDNEKDNPKLEAGSCRIVNAGLPDEVNEYLINKSRETDSMFSNEHAHFYYYWMLDNNRTVKEDIMNGYNKAKNAKFDKIRDIIRDSLEYSNMINRDVS